MTMMMLQALTFSMRSDIPRVAEGRLLKKYLMWVSLV